MAKQATSIAVYDDRVEVVVPGEKRLFRSRPERTVVFRWEDVTRTFVFKRDVYAVDMICMAVELKDGSSIELNEEMTAWDALVAAVPLRLQGALSMHEWFCKVAFPAFALCWTQIYPRLSEAESKTAATEIQFN